jgi:hypothetical protein
MELLRLNGIALNYELDDWGFESRQGLGILSSPPCPDWLWGPLIIPSNEYRCSFTGGKMIGV